MIVPRAPLDLRRLAAEHTEQNIKLLAEFANSPQVPTQYRLQAIGMLLDRAYGRPKQPIAGADGEGPLKVVIVYPQKDDS